MTSAASQRQIAATVLVPTHDHWPLLSYSVGSALAQTTEDIEVFIIGDGVPDPTRDVVADLIRQDQRVRFFDHAKGPRHGEILRHAALMEARGEIIAYLADDDLWLPDHLEVMREQLSDADFTHTMSLSVDGHDDLCARTTVDLAQAGVREALAAGNKIAGISLSCVAHTTDLYRRLPYGWRTTPDNIPTDFFMWTQILSQPWCRARSGTRPTCIRFPTVRRTDWSEARRVDELSRWAAAVADPAWRTGLERRILDLYVKDHFARHLRIRDLRAKISAKATAKASGKAS